MDELIYSTKVEIELQGKEVLEYLGDEDLVPTFRVLGFDQDIILLRDQRRSSRVEIETYLYSQDIDRFLSYFCSPALIDMNSNRNRCIINIFDDFSLKPASQSLWIAIGMGKELPAFEYVFHHSIPLEDNTFAILAIYLHPGHQDPHPSLNRSGLATTRA